MEIRGEHSCITIEPVDRVPADLPCAGDLELSVEISSQQFGAMDLCGSRPLQWLIS